MLVLGICAKSLTGSSAAAGVDYRVLVVAMALVTACCGVWLSTRRTIERAAAPALA